MTNHDATLFKGIGCYEGKEKTLIYSVINSEAKRELLPLIRSIDEHAFINVVKTEELDGRFHDIPHDWECLAINENIENVEKGKWRRSVSSTA